MNCLYYPLECVESHFEVKGSTFISYLLPISLFDTTLLKMRQRHSKAVHFVTARRFLNAQGQIIESFSDDGEPKGTSGMPTLKVLRGYELINCGILTIRYFGGTLLGTGGLVRAYTQGAKDVVLCARDSLALYVPLESLEIKVAFGHFAKVEHYAQKFGITIYKKDFLSDGVCLSIQGAKEDLEGFLNKVQALSF